MSIAAKSAKLSLYQLFRRRCCCSLLHLTSSVLHLLKRTKLRKVPILPGQFVPEENCPGNIYETRTELDIDRSMRQ